MGVLLRSEIMSVMTEEEFFKFCQENDTLGFERNANGEIIVIMPTGAKMGRYNSEINRQIGNWNEKTKSGWVFDSNTGFTLPNKAVRSPDVSFISHKRWSEVPEDDQEKFAHICPDFVIEIQSISDDTKTLQDKMKEYIENGCSLAWMINPQRKETWVFRKNGEVEIKPFNDLLSGEDVLPGFALDLNRIFY